MEDQMEIRKVRAVELFERLVQVADLLSQIITRDNLASLPTILR
jgi:hypothetical protein